MSCSDCSAVMIWVWLVMLWVLYGQNMGSWYGSRRVLTRFVGDFLIISCSDCRSVMIWVWLVMIWVLLSQDMDTAWLCYDWYGSRRVVTWELVVSWYHAATEVQSWYGYDCSWYDNFVSMIWMQRSRVMNAVQSWYVGGFFFSRYVVTVGQSWCGFDWSWYKNCAGIMWM